MKNSPWTCQLYVAYILVNVPKDIVLVYYIDDLLLTHPDLAYLQRIVK